MCKIRYDAAHRNTCRSLTVTRQTISGSDTIPQQWMQHNIVLHALAFFLCTFLSRCVPVHFPFSQCYPTASLFERWKRTNRNMNQENGENAKWNERWLEEIEKKKKNFSMEKAQHTLRCVCDFTAATFCNRQQMDSCAIRKCAWCIHFFWHPVAVHRSCNWWHGSNDWYFLCKKALHRWHSVP